VVGGFTLGLGGHVVGEVVRQAPDDGRDGGSVSSREAADGKHAGYRATDSEDLSSHLKINGPD
jgi:hypothetical protein